MSPKLVLQEGAILIADAHYSQKYPQFYSFLQAVDLGKIKTSQLILMGDMFELLFGPIKRTYIDNEKEIVLLNKISQHTEVIYFEGNHDFCIKDVFPDILVFPLKAQPKIVHFGDKKVMLSHGDTKMPFGYQVYTKFIRNTLVLKLVGLLDILCLNCLFKWLKHRGEEKNHCYKIDLFKEIIERRLHYIKHETLDIVIEGHFHQDVSFKLYDFEYINLASFACNQKYFIVQSINGQLFLQETRFKES